MAHRTILFPSRTFTQYALAANVYISEDVAACGVAAALQQLHMDFGFMFLFNYA